MFLMTTLRPLTFSSLFCCALAMGACATGTGDTDAGGGDPFEQAEQDVIDAVATYDTAGFTKINTDIIETVHGASTHANVWVTNAHADLYKELDPTDPNDARGAFPSGMIVVKEQVNADGTSADRLLVMSKFDEGYNADDNDWWWGLFTNQTTPSGDIGVVSFCIDCHVSSELVDTDYMLGVDPANHAD
jgi:hypothetical protein